MEQLEKAQQEDGPAEEHQLQNHLPPTTNSIRPSSRSYNAAQNSNPGAPGPSTSYLSVSHMVRQQSDTTHNNRRLVRSQAVCDDRPATSCDQVNIFVF